MKKQCKYAILHKKDMTTDIDIYGSCLICQHAVQHEQTPECFVRHCSVHSKDVRCITEESK